MKKKKPATKKEMEKAVESVKRFGEACRRLKKELGLSEDDFL